MARKLRVGVVQLRSGIEPAANRAAAVERFFELLCAALAVPRARKPTRVPRGAHERRLRTKREHSARKQGRSAGPGEE